MTATTDLFTSTLTREDRAVVDAYGAAARDATDAQLTEWATFHRAHIDRAYANGGHPRAHVLLLSVVEDEQDRRYYEDASVV